MGPKTDPKDDTDATEDETDDEEDKGEGGENEIDLIGKYLGDRNTRKERDGNGWAILPNGDQYDGQYRKDQRHGEGLYVFKNGARYKGRYRCGIKSGYGVFYYPDGSKYEGNWRKDLKHGIGTYTYPNGDIYRGNWYKGKRHGLGEYFFSENNCYFKGTWVDGVRVGPAEVHYKKHTLHGIWDDKYPQGPAIFSFNCKYMYKGYYKLLKSKTLLGIGEEGGEEMREGIEEEIGKEEMQLELEGEGDYEIRNKASLEAVQRAIPQWYCQELLRYEFSKLPQQPVPLPISDSEEDICDLSLQPSPHRGEGYNEEEGGEFDAKDIPSPRGSKTSLSWTGATSPCVSTTPDISQVSRLLLNTKTPAD